MFAICSVANDDQYATNVPDTCDDVTSSSNATEVRGQQLPMAMEVDGEGVREKEFWYLAQLRRSQYPINGIYRLSRNTAHNHFRKYTDVKHKGTYTRGTLDKFLLEAGRGGGGCRSGGLYAINKHYYLNSGKAIN